MWVFEAENSQVWFSPGRVSEQLRTWLRHRQHPARIEVLRGEDAQPVNRISRLDLGNCGLHATGLDMLQKVLLDLEHRGDGLAVEELVLDGNDFGDAGTVAIASLLRLSSKLRVLRLRNVGITDGGFSQMISAMVSNKSLVLLDLRGNGLCSLENSKIALQGLRRFNTVAEVLLE
ncbi:Ribonuclease inhibitor (Ribonuclease/angiogenin inhibitor 1) [Durusdinium trenchii]|uniref:Ribonuclease inhibitor (Ribonuclease/angiogenin inhibitor 1) n=1 Tax=Durusdinium trenchii TaxID=1381693 RepID=A0ABP0LJD5_9DINO